ncbi:MAG TPA: nucleotidyltransferase domain-containing protein [Polyangiaceae bacterium]|jgi:hypothetical protein|nr:nucleotidyltransferase domain-containing protein [Polyangiaceae bacterium]
MFAHQAETLERVSAHFSADPAVSALLLGGSIAHGFHSEQSDVDVMIVVSDEDHRERLGTPRACFFSRELCTYEGGYVDGKYISEGFLREVAARGSEPARYAFQDARVVFSRSATLSPLLAEIPRYPLEDKAARIQRFQGQVEAWLWYCSEALKRQNLPLLRTAVAKLTLFGGRLVLAHNEMLYPYLKWFLRVLATAPEQPPGLVPLIEQLAVEPARERIDRFGKLIKEFKGWDMNAWGAQFLQDSELSWFYSSAPVDDI